MSGKQKRKTAKQDVVAPSPLAPCHFCQVLVDRADHHCSGCDHVTCSTCDTESPMGSHDVDDHVRGESRDSLDAEW